MPDGTMYSQSCNYYYGPLYGQGLVPDYPPGRDQVASQRLVSRSQTHTKSGRESGDSHIELVLIGQGISMGDN